MIRDEIKELISFIDKSNRLFDIDEEAISNNSIWEIYSFLMICHLDNKIVTTSSLASACSLPRATAIRKINKLIQKKIIIQKIKTTSGKSFSLHPSKNLINTFNEYLKKIKYHVASSMGYEKDQQGYYFGTSVFSSNVISSPAIMNINCPAKLQIKLLLNDNMTFKVIEKNKQFIESMIGLKLDIKILNNMLLRKEIIKNSKLKKSKYDIICFDMPWTGELHQNKYLTPLNDIINSTNFNLKDFHPAGVKASTFNHKLLGLPIEEVASIMVYRSDIFKKLNLKIPKNISEFFLNLKIISESKIIKYPFSWPGISGFPIGCHIMEMMGNLGRPLMKIRKISDGIYDTAHLNIDDNNIDIDNREFSESVFLISKMLKYSHPNVLNMSWDEVAESYSNGEVAVANIWSGRSSLFESDIYSPAHHNTIVSAKPGGIEGFKASSIGGYSLGIPSNLSSNRIKTAFSVIKYLTSPAMIKFYINNGVSSSTLFSVSNDPEVKNRCPSLGYIDDLQKKGYIKDWLRLPVPKYHQIAEYIGKTIHSEILNKKNNFSRVYCQKLATKIQSEIFKKIDNHESQFDTKNYF